MEAKEIKKALEMLDIEIDSHYGENRWKSLEIREELFNELHKNLGLTYYKGIPYKINEGIEGWRLKGWESGLPIEAKYEDSKVEENVPSYLHFTPPGVLAPSIEVVRVDLSHPRCAEKLNELLTKHKYTRIEILGSSGDIILVALYY